MTEERIITMHPLGKSGRSISKNNYEIVKQSILKTLQNNELTHTELIDQLVKKLGGKFKENISWYGMTIKLDLEARKIIERTRATPQKYRLKLTDN